MEQPSMLGQFITSEAGLVTACVLIFIGVSDIITAWWVMKHRPDFMQTFDSQDLYKALGFFMPLACFMVLCGLYILSFHI
jgi:hypothetical protein